jgi:hypothetical protein
MVELLRKRTTTEKLRGRSRTLMMNGTSIVSLRALQWQPCSISVGLWRDIPQPNQWPCRILNVNTRFQDSEGYFETICDQSKCIGKFSERNNAACVLLSSPKTINCALHNSFLLGKLAL